MFFENLKMAFKTLGSNKMRSFLTMLGIIIGIASVISILTVGNSLTQSVSENMQSIGANDVYLAVVEKGANNNKISKNLYDGVVFKGNISLKMTDDDYITPDMIHELSKKFKDDIYAINIQNSIGRGTINDGRDTEKVALTGVSAGFFVTNKIKMDAGNFFSNTDFSDMHNVALIQKSTAKKLFGEDISKAVGKVIQIQIKGSTQEFYVGGVYENSGATSGGKSTPMMSMMGASVYIPLKTSYHMLHDIEKFSYIQLVTKVGTDSNDLSDKVSSFMDQYYRNNDNFKVMSLTLEGMFNMLTKLLNTITMAISIIAGIALLVGGIGVMNIMLVSVTERTREIGTRKALGARNSDIRMQFISEAVIICLIGGIIGVILGLTLGTLFSNILNYPARPSIFGILVAIVFSMSIGVFFGSFPANKAAKMNPIDALRYE